MNIKRLLGCEDMTWTEIALCLAAAVAAFLYIATAFIDALPGS